MFRSSKDVSIVLNPNQNQYDQLELEDGYLCDMCTDGPFTTELDVDIHRRSAHRYEIIQQLRDENVTMCSICLYEQQDKEALIQHILVSHFCSQPNSKIINREIFICDYCNRLFFNKELLITHIYHFHIQKTVKNVTNIRHSCPRCNKIIAGKSTYFHLLYHGLFNSRVCPICLKSFNKNTEVLKHMTSHKLYLKCNICGFTTMKERFFQNHLERHKKKMIVYSNKDVSKYFLPQQTYPSLRNRFINILKGIPFANQVKICILCRAVCLSEDEMLQHINGDHSPEQKEKTKQYKCLCGEVFFNNVLLKHHVFKLTSGHYILEAEDQFMGIIQHICACGLEFPNSLLLKQHLVQISSTHGVADDTDEMVETQTSSNIMLPEYDLNEPMEVNVQEIVVIGI